MLCTSPRDAWQPLSGGSLIFSRNYSGSRGRECIQDMSFRQKFSSEFRHLYLPCGQCLSCRIDRARQDAVRCMHEFQSHQELGFGSSFITLTYDDSHLPAGGTLVKDDFRKFAFRLRSRLAYESFGHQLSIFYCGEYGERFRRPHFHAAIFGYDFPDKFAVEASFSGSPQFDSSFLNDVWGNGRTRIGTLTFDSAAYVARYTTKKVTGKKAASHYGDRMPEFAEYPRGRGNALGRKWFEKYWSDVFPADEVTMLNDAGVAYHQRPPRYYVKLLEKQNPEMFKLISLKRREHARSMDAADAESDFARQKMRRDYMIEKFKVFRRELEL